MQYLNFFSSVSSSPWPETGLQKMLTEHDPEWPEIFGDTCVLHGYAVGEAVAPKICRHKHHSVYLHLVTPLVFFPPLISNWDDWGWQFKAFRWKEPFFGSSWKTCELQSQRQELTAALLLLSWMLLESSILDGNKFPSAGMCFFLHFFCVLFVGLGNILSFCVPYYKGVLEEAQWKIGGYNLQT